MSAPEGAVYFGAVTLHQGRLTFYGNPDVPIEELTGKLVNLGSKDGAVFERVTVTGADDRGVLSFEGGRTGWPWQPEREPVELPGTQYIWAYEVARGFIWPGEASGA